MVAIISPWNYPFTMALVDGIAAIAAGNAVVSKPDHHTPLSALFGLQLLEEAGLPEGLWQMVTGAGRVLGGPMIERADYVCFTGSTATGRVIARQCADPVSYTHLDVYKRQVMSAAGRTKPETRVVRNRPCARRGSRASSCPQRSSPCDQRPGCRWRRW